LFLGLLAFIRRHANNVAPKRLPPDISNTASVWSVIATTGYPVVGGIGVLRLCFRPVRRRNADTIAILSVAPNITALAPSSGSPYRYGKCERNHDCDDKNFRHRFRLHCCFPLLFAQLVQLLRAQVTCCKPNFTGCLAASLKLSIRKLTASSRICQWHVERKGKAPPRIVPLPLLRRPSASREDGVFTRFHAVYIKARCF